MSEREVHAEHAASDEGAPKLSERLAGSHVALRSDLQVYRHLFRSEPSYVFRDPMTMQSHRFDLHDYRILIRIRAERSLAEIFASLVEEDLLQPEEEEEFYHFILELHQLAFLTLPVPNDRILYRRHVQKQRARRHQQIKGVLFLKLPLVNPNAFLDRTQRWVRPLFSRPFFFVWLGMLAISGFLAARNASALLEPAHGILDARNLAFMWVALIGLKLVHEFGHAYACKLRGGEVPEMGVFLVVFTPLAYVDASSAWSFVRRRERLVVSLAGVYVESIFAMLALFVWVAAESSLVRMVAHDVMLLASLVTLVANANPLMRFDGYYVLSDLLEIPNLRARAEQRVRAALKRVAFGIPAAPDGHGRGMHAFLVTFGVAASVYRVTLVFSISLLIATKAFLLGIVIAASYAGSQLLNAVRGLAHFLLYSEETRSQRGRGVGLAVALLVALPIALVVVPVPGSVRVTGVVGREFEEVLVARQQGFVRSIPVQPGNRLEAGSLVVRLANPELRERLMEAEADYELARLHARALEERDPGGARGARQVLEAKGGDVARRRAELAELEVRSPRDGVLVAGLTPSDVERFVRQNEAIGMLVAGGWHLRALLRGDQLAATRPEVGQEVVLRSPATPGRTLRGRVLRVAAAGSRSVELESLTQVAGGEIPVDGGSLQADQPYFEVLVELDEPDPRLRHGMTSQVQLAAVAEPLAVSGHRVVKRIINRISRD